MRRFTLIKRRIEKIIYLCGINGAEQLYFGSNTWYLTCPGYWKCTDCNAPLYTKGTMHVVLCLNEPSKPLPQNRGHNSVFDREYKIRRHFKIIKEKITNETEALSCTIFDQMIKKLEIVHTTCDCKLCLALCSL